MEIIKELKAIIWTSIKVSDKILILKLLYPKDKNIWIEFMGNFPPDYKVSGYSKKIFYKTVNGLSTIMKIWVDILCNK